MNKSKILKSKQKLQSLHKVYFEELKVLKPYEEYLKENGITFQDLRKGKFVELKNDFTRTNKVVRILLYNCIESYSKISYEYKEFNRLNREFLNKETFYKVIKIAIKRLCYYMIEEKYNFSTNRLGVFKVVHRYVKDCINWEDSELNKKRLKEEGKFKEGTEWVVKKDTTFLIVEWVRDKNIPSQKHLNSYDFKSNRGEYGMLNMLSKKRKQLTMSEIISYPPYREATPMKIKTK